MKLELGIPSRRFSETGMAKGGYCFMAVMMSPDQVNTNKAVRFQIFGLMTPNKILSLLKVQWISTYLAGKDISRILQDSLGYVDDVFHIKLLFVSIAKFLTCCLISAKPFISTDFSGTKAYDHQLISQYFGQNLQSVTFSYENVVSTTRCLLS